MYLPMYSRFSFAIAKNTTDRTVWHTCKEYAGRALGRRNPKKYVTITMWNGWREDIWPSDESGCSPITQDIINDLRAYINARGKELGIKNDVSITAIPGYAGCIHIKVPPDWCHNRITAHLLLTYIRHQIGNNSMDISHLAAADKLITHAKKVKIDKFNEQMKALNPFGYLRGIVNASQNFHYQD